MPAPKLLNLLPHIVAFVLSHKLDGVTNYFDFDVFVYFRWFFDKANGSFFGQLDVKRWMIIDLKNPNLHLTINKYIKAKDLEAITFGLFKFPRELILLSYVLEWLYCKKRFVTDFFDLIKDDLSINTLFLKLLKYSLKWSLTCKFKTELIKSL